MCESSERHGDAPTLLPAARDTPAGVVSGLLKLVRCSSVAATPTIAAVRLVVLTAVVLVVRVLVLLGLVVGMVGWRCVVRLSSDERAGGGAGAGAGAAHARGGGRVVVPHTLEASRFAGGRSSWRRGQLA